MKQYPNKKQKETPTMRNAIPLDTITLAILIVGIAIGYTIRKEKSK